MRKFTKFSVSSYILFVFIERRGQLLNGVKVTVNYIQIVQDFAVAIVINLRNCFVYAHFSAVENANKLCICSFLNAISKLIL